MLTAAGLGSRFKDYSNIPKPFIEVNGKPMWVHAITPWLKYGRPILVFQRDHSKFFKEPNFNYNIVWLDKITEGAAETAYLGCADLNEDEPVCFIDSDGYIEFDNWDYSIGGTFVIKHSDPKNSYVKTKNGYITEIKEKEVISSLANTGHYWWQSVKQFKQVFEFARQNSLKIKNEYYMAPMYNIAISQGHKFKTHLVNKWVCWGTPNDLEYYLKL